jgi:hypothetical protein
MEKNGAIDSFPHVISKSAKCNEREAAECIAIGIYKKQEEAFTSIVLEKGMNMGKSWKRKGMIAERTPFFFLKESPMHR